MQNKEGSVIIDGGSCTNIASTTMVEKLDEGYKTGVSILLNREI